MVNKGLVYKRKLKLLKQRQFCLPESNGILYDISTSWCWSNATRADEALPFSAFYVSVKLGLLQMAGQPYFRID